MNSKPLLENHKEELRAMYITSLVLANQAAKTRQELEDKIASIQGEYFEGEGIQTTVNFDTNEISCQSIPTSAEAAAK